MNTTPTPFKSALARCGRFLLFLLRGVLPWYVASHLLLTSGWLAKAASHLGGFMDIWGLPPEAAAAVAAGMGANLYAAAAVAAALGLSWKQLTVMGVMLGVAHSLPVEHAVLVELVGKARAAALTTTRIVVGAIAGWAVSICLG